MPFDSTQDTEPNTLWSRNTVLIQILGLSPVLAVSTTVVNGIGLGLATALATIASCLTVSLFRSIIGDTWRLTYYMLIIACYVTAIDLMIQLYFYPLYRSLGVYIPLICGNAALLYHMETYARKSPPGPALLDSINTAAGFLWVILIFSAIREWSSTGSLFTQLELLSPFPTQNVTEPISTLATGQRFNFPLSQPGAFIILGFLIATRNLADKLYKKTEPKKNDTNSD